MEKQTITHKRPLSNQLSSPPHNSHNVPEKYNSPPLGGIHLYNECYRRHLERPKQSFLGNCSDKKLFFSSSGLKKEREALNEQLDLEYQGDESIMSVVNKERKGWFQQGHNTREEIENIIGSLKSVHFTARTLIHEIEKHQVQNQFQSLDNFDDLIHTYNQNNQESFTLLLTRIFTKLKHKMNLQIQQIQQECQKRLEEKRSKVRDQETQTYVRNVEKDIDELKSQLKKKDVEYNVLYDFKKSKLSKKDTFISSMNLEEKLHQIVKLEEENKAKSLEIKRLKKQVDNVQDKFFCKLIENQRKESLLLKADLESIFEDQYFGDNPKIRKKVRNNIVQRKNGGSHLISRLSLDQNQIAEKFMGLIASAFDVNGKPTSMKELPLHFSDFESQISLEGRRSSKKSAEKRSIKRIMEKYQLKDKVKKSSLRKQKEARTSKNQSVKLITSEKQLKVRRANITMDNEADKVKLDQEEDNPQRIPTQTPDHHHSNNNNNKATKAVIKADTQSNQSKKYIKSETEEDQTSKFSSFKVLRADKPDKSDKADKGDKGDRADRGERQDKKKLKKGVSFQLDQLIARSFFCFSKQIDFCFDPSGEGQKVGSSCVGVRRLAKKIVYNCGQIVQQENEQMTENRDKGKQKGKLVKTKAKQKKHFKVISCLESLIRNSSKFQEQQEEGSADMTASPLSKRDQNRFSFKQTLTKVNGGKDQRATFQRASYSYKQSPQEQLQDNQQNQTITELAIKIKNRQQFYSKIKQLHKTCGEHCLHIKKYLEIFDKVRERSTRPTIKLNYENVNRHISPSSGCLVRVRSQTGQERKRGCDVEDMK